MMSTARQKVHNISSDTYKFWNLEIETYKYACESQFVLFRSRVCFVIVEFLCTNCHMSTDADIQKGWYFFSSKSLFIWKCYWGLTDITPKLQFPLVLKPCSLPVCFGDLLPAFSQNLEIKWMVRMYWDSKKGAYYAPFFEILRHFCF